VIFSDLSVGILRRFLPEIVSTLRLKTKEVTERVKVIKLKVEPQDNRNRKLLLLGGANGSFTRIL